MPSTKSSGNRRSGRCNKPLKGLLPLACHVPEADETKRRRSDWMRAIFRLAELTWASCYTTTANARAAPDSLGADCAADKPAEDVIQASASVFVAKTCRRIRGASLPRRGTITRQHRGLSSLTYAASERIMEHPRVTTDAIRLASDSYLSSKILMMSSFWAPL